MLLDKDVFKAAEESFEKCKDVLSNLLCLTSDFEQMSSKGFKDLYEARKHLKLLSNDLSNEINKLDKKREELKVLVQNSVNDLNAKAKTLRPDEAKKLKDQNDQAVNVLKNHIQEQENVVKTFIHKIKTVSKNIQSVLCGTFNYNKEINSSMEVLREEIETQTATISGKGSTQNNEKLNQVKNHYNYLKALMDYIV